MAATAHSFNIGSFRCTIASDGTLVPGDGGDPLGLNFLLIDTGEAKILIDSGCGEGFQTTAGTLVSNLKTAGISPADVDIILFSHGHMDHVLGAFDRYHKPVFINARYVATRIEWDHWVAGPGTDELQNMFFEPARDYLVKLRDKFDLVDTNASVRAGVRLHPAPGHTPGNVTVDIASASSRLFCIGDIIHSPKELTDLRYLSRVDVEPELAVTTRENVFSELAASGTLVFACHFTFPGLGYITLQNGVLNWQAA